MFFPYCCITIFKNYLIKLKMFIIVNILNAKKEKKIIRQKFMKMQQCIYNTLDDNYFHGTNIIMMVKCQKFCSRQFWKYIETKYHFIRQKNHQTKNLWKHSSVSCFRSRWQLFQRNQHHDDGMMSTQKGTTSDLWPLLWVVLSFVLLLGGVVKGPSYIKKGLI